jgi:lipopolysaccharide/colanic/teichoic acid biosynthesis glycosyltransferase
VALPLFRDTSFADLIQAQNTAHESATVTPMSLSQHMAKGSNLKFLRFHEFLPPDRFLRMLFLERKRSERSERPFVLMLLECTKLLRHGDQGVLDRVLSALVSSTRDTDVKGWYDEHVTIGVIFTELGSKADGKSVANALLSKVTSALASMLTINEIREIRIWLRVFPDNWSGRPGPIDDIESAFYDKVFNENAQHPFAKIVKRSMDIAVSLLVLSLGFAVFLFIALAIKLTSRGPVLYRQERLGQYGRKFGILKFRSMHVTCDDCLHREYVKRFIAGASGCHQAGSTQMQYKIVNDPRVTRVGRLLRKTSLDELPQFLNVLRGEMSLVGPRPPLPYEVESYRMWHKARFLVAKPGITGLWQVQGRSRVKFDEMVRMDLKYAKTRSLWLDIKILLQTPRAVLFGTGGH